MRLSELRRTTGFRLALLLLATFGTGALIVFGFLYFEIAGFVFRDIDTGLAREVAALADESPAELARRVNERVLLDPAARRPFTLFDSTGRWLAGSEAALPQPLPPFDRPFDFTMPLGGAPAPYRGMVHRLASGTLFLAAESTSGIHRFQRLLTATLISGGLVILVIGLAGGMIVGAGALGRLNRISRAIERIVGGDLSERLPIGGRHGDLARLIEVVNRMLDEIERLMREVKGVTEDVAHDLRTPLTRLLAGLERVRRRATTPAEYEAAVDEAIVETKGILATFTALLRIAEVESGARRAGFTTFDLDTVAADVAELYEPVAEGKDIALSLERAAGARAEIAGDPSLLFEAISNLVDNAIKYSPRGGRVMVRVLAASDRLGVEVSDTGSGIPEAERDAVLRRFHRLEKCRSTPGSGLGLSLVAAVARLHDLQITIEDAQPGCRVTLWRAGSEHAPIEPIPASAAARESGGPEQDRVNGPLRPPVSRAP